ncbi:MAG TPA: hypothetical protein DHW78_03645 [Ruminococcaceae bacterium]|jgi:hypothetical protein|nr:hypothetical protein [Oscillospiraceae bacterium]
MAQFVKVYLWLNIFDIKDEEDEYAHMPTVNATLCDPQKNRQREENDCNFQYRKNFILSTVQTYALPDGYSVELDKQGVPTIFHNGSPCSLGWDFDEEVYLECGEDIIPLQLVDL